MPLGRHTTQAAAASCVALALLLASCSSSERSKDAFCDRLHEGKQEIVAHMNETAGTGSQSGEADDPFMSLLAIGGGVVELRDFTHDLAEVAPNEIKDDMQALADYADQVFQQVGKSIDDPLGAGLNTAMGAISIQRNLRAVDAFAEENCGEGI